MPSKWRRALETVNEAIDGRAPTEHGHPELEAAGAAAAAVAAHEAGLPHGPTAWADVTGKPATFAPSAHGHDYASITHNHDELYEAAGALADHEANFPHGGVADWADITNKPATFPPATHDHAGLYAVLVHNHDAAYSALAHNHDASYSAIGHNHAGAYEPANSNIQVHVASGHAPSDAQKNSDITKGEIEAKLTGAIASHSHAGSGGDPVYAPGSFTLATGTYRTVAGTLIMTSTQRLTGEGTARLRGI